jgi:hypothetical protein
MDFFSVVNLSKINWSFIERRVLGGKETNVLVIPCNNGQVFRSRKGDITIRYFVRENDRMEANGCTHKMNIAWMSKDYRSTLDAETRENAKDAGKLSPCLNNNGYEINYDNSAATPIYAKGAICLDELEARHIHINCKTGQKTVQCAFRNLNSDGTPIFLVGKIYLNEIFQEDVTVNPITGKRNIFCVLKKKEFMDKTRNTHHLVILKPRGGEIEIGVFQEYRQSTEAQKRIAEIEETIKRESTLNDDASVEEDRPPLQIDGYKL